MQTLEIEIRNPNGLHLRPLGQFVRTCGRTRSEVTIQNLATGAGPVNAKQMLRVQPLGVRLGHVVRITAEGDDEVEAIATIRAAIEAGLGEEVAPAAVAGLPGEAAVRPPAPVAERAPAALPASPAPPPLPPDAAAGRLAGLGAVAGIAVAPAWRYREQAAGATQPASGDPAAAIRAAAAAAESQLEALAARIRDAGRPDDAGIFEAQAVLATDPTIVDEALGRGRRRGRSRDCRRRGRGRGGHGHRGPRRRAARGAGRGRARRRGPHRPDPAGRDARPARPAR